MARTVPVSSTQAPGNFITGALWNAGPAASNSFLTAVPVAALVQVTATTSLTSGAWTPIGFDGTTYDSDSQHSNVTNNTRFTCQVPGLYVAQCTAAFASNSANMRGSRILKNGASIVQGFTGFQQTATSDVCTVTCPLTPFQLAVGDYLEGLAIQLSGGSLNTVIRTDITSSMAVYWLRS